MPRRIDLEDDDEMPRRRRRSAKAVAAEAEEERGLVMRMLLHSPKDMIAGVLAAAAVSAIIANALFLQAGRHPSPMFGTVIAIPAPSRARQSAAASAPGRGRDAESSSRWHRRSRRRPVEAKTADPKHADPKTTRNDAMTSLVVKSTAPAAAAPSNVARPPAPIPARGEPRNHPPRRRIAGVQRALTEYGYGQLKPTGTIGADTQAAISKFERDRKLPVTGQMSDRLVKELTAMTGRPID